MVSGAILTAFCTDKLHLVVLLIYCDLKSIVSLFSQFAEDYLFSTPFSFLHFPPASFYSSRKCYDSALLRGLQFSSLGLFAIRGFLD